MAHKIKLALGVIVVLTGMVLYKVNFDRQNQKKKKPRT